MLTTASSNEIKNRKEKKISSDISKGNYFLSQIRFFASGRIMRGEEHTSEERNTNWKMIDIIKSLTLEENKLLRSYLKENFV